MSAALALSGLALLNILPGTAQPACSMYNTRHNLVYRYCTVCSLYTRYAHICLKKIEYNGDRDIILILLQYVYITSVLMLYRCSEIRRFHHKPGKDQRFHIIKIMHICPRGQSNRLIEFLSPDHII